MNKILITMKYLLNGGSLKIKDQEYFLHKTEENKYVFGIKLETNKEEYICSLDLSFEAILNVIEKIPDNKIVEYSAANVLKERHALADDKFEQKNEEN